MLNVLPFAGRFYAWRLISWCLTGNWMWSFHDFCSRVSYSTFKSVVRTFIFGPDHTCVSHFRRNLSCISYEQRKYGRPNWHWQQEKEGDRRREDAPAKTGIPAKHLVRPVLIEFSQGGTFFGNQIITMKFILLGYSIEMHQLHKNPIIFRKIVLWFMKKVDGWQLESHPLT